MRSQNKISCRFNGTLALYGDDTPADFDLSYSVGKASYKMLIKKAGSINISGPFGSFSYTAYYVNVSLTDRYDFDEYRSGNSLGNILNNFGYDMQKAGVIIPYEWESTYSTFMIWKDNE